MSPVAAPAIVTKTADGKILAVSPLKPVRIRALFNSPWDECARQWFIAQRRKG